MDLAGLVEGMVRDGRFSTVVNNPLAQFGTARRRYLGAEILPERLRPENKYREEDVAYRTFVANSATRYSPVQLKGGALVGSMEVELAESDTGDQLTGSDYEAVIRLIERASNGGGNRPELEAITQILRWSDASLNLPLIELNEVQRWQALVNAQIIRTGDNAYREVVNFSAPTGHRPNALGAWSNNAVDPMADLSAAKTFLSAKGFTITRIIAGTPVIAKLQANALMRNRVGVISVQAGSVIGQPGILDINSLNNIMTANDLPPIEKYDLTYRMQSASGGTQTHFLARDVMVLVCETGRDQTIEIQGDEPLLVQNTLGYVGVGRAVGQTQAGRVIPAPRVFTNTKPPRIEGESWQTAFPVIQDPEAVYVIKAIT